MKKLIYIISFVFFLWPFSVNAIEEKEEKLFYYYNKSASCAVAYNYQQRYAKIANLIDNGSNSKNLMINLESTVTAWITISITLEQLLIRHYAWTDQGLKSYRDDQFKQISIISGREFFILQPEQFLGKLFNATNNCPQLAVEIQEFVMSFGSNINPPNQDDKSTDDKPKRKM